MTLLIIKIVKYHSLRASLNSYDTVRSDYCLRRSSISRRVKWGRQSKMQRRSRHSPISRDCIVAIANGHLRRHKQVASGSSYGRLTTPYKLRQCSTN